MENNLLLHRNIKRMTQIWHYLKMVFAAKKHLIKVLRQEKRYSSHQAHGQHSKKERTSQLTYKNWKNEYWPNGKTLITGLLWRQFNSGDINPSQKPTMDTSNINSDTDTIRINLQTSFSVEIVWLDDMIWRLNVDINFCIMSSMFDVPLAHSNSLNIEELRKVRLLKSISKAFWNCILIH